jgi:hypothetical protein
MTRNVRSAALMALVSIAACHPTHDIESAQTSALTIQLTYTPTAKVALPTSVYYVGGVQGISPPPQPGNPPFKTVISTQPPVPFVTGPTSSLTNSDSFTNLQPGTWNVGMNIVGGYLALSNVTCTIALQGVSPQAPAVRLSVALVGDLTGPLSFQGPPGTTCSVTSGPKTPSQSQPNN